MTLRSAQGIRFSHHVPVLVIGAGPAGLAAACAATQTGAVLAVDAAAQPGGSLRIGAALIPACSTRAQAEAGIADDPDRFAADLDRAAGGRGDGRLLARLASQSAALLEWLERLLGLDLPLQTSWGGCGHSLPRLHGLGAADGTQLAQALASALLRDGGQLWTEARAEELIVDGDRVVGAGITRADGGLTRLSCDALVLACGGFGRDTALRRQYLGWLDSLPSVSPAQNHGQALRWGHALGARLGDLGAYRLHLVTTEGGPVPWLLVQQGGILLDRQGERFCDETHAASAAETALRREDEVLWLIWDGRIDQMICETELGGAWRRRSPVLRGDDANSLAQDMRLATNALRRSLGDTADMVLGTVEDPLGRAFIGLPEMAPPYYACPVHPALMGSLGGLVTDLDGRVLGDQGLGSAQIFAAGAAARGVNGPAGGYLEGSGLLAAFWRGRRAGETAAQAAKQ